MGRNRKPLDAAQRAVSDRMRALAREPGGVITAAQCGALGAGASMVRSLPGGGERHRVRRGVYGDARWWPPGCTATHLRRCAAVLAGLRSTAAVVSHTSAARLLELPLPPRVDPRITITRRPPAPTSGPRSGTVRVAVHLARYDDADVVCLDGIPVLAGARLVLDCCDAMPPDSALAIADAALARGLTSPDRLHDEVARRRGRPGAKLARLVVGRADPLAESWFESSSRWWLLEAGLPRPQLQVRFTDDRGLVRVKVDMLMRDTWTVGEADGAGKYDEPGALFAEKRREDWLRDAHRLEVVRWVPQEMRTPAGRAEVADRFRRAFARHRRTG